MVDEQNHVGVVPQASLQRTSPDRLGEAILTANVVGGLEGGGVADESRAVRPFAAQLE